MVKLKIYTKLGGKLLNIDRALLDKLRKDKRIKKTITSKNVDVAGEITKIVPIVENHVKGSNVEKASNWMLFKDLWLQNESGLLKTNITYRNYTRGSIVMSIDWGTSNVGTEIRYPHPGVVLYDQGEDWVIVAPVTAARVNQETKTPIIHKPFEVLGSKQNVKPADENEYWFRKDSVIQVDQIQRLSKYRIINKNSYKIRTNLLNEIDNIILEHYIPRKHTHVNDLKALLLEKNEELRKAHADIARLTSELKLLRGGDDQ